MNTAFIIGNGTSRKGFDLTRLKPYGTVFGCNALYRDFPDYSLPDFLVSIDDGIITEIEHSDFPSKRFIVPPMDERLEGKSDPSISVMIPSSILTRKSGIEWSG